MKIAITGTTGLIGHALTDWFRHNKSEVWRLVRPQTPENGEREIIKWDYIKGSIEKDKLEGFDAVIHLAGANIAAKRWSKNYKKEILNSRIESTRFLAKSLAVLNNPPKVFLSASAIGYYGSRSARDIVDEKSEGGKGFLPEVCREWESAAQPAQDKGIRVVYMRFGTVLSSRGGALAKMLPVFQYGLGGRLGRGDQMMSWVALSEIPVIINWLIYHKEITGPVNIVSPESVTNLEFTNALGRAIKRPVIFPVPEFAVKTLFGEMGRELLLEGANIWPGKLMEKDYKFVFPELKTALSAVLN